MDGYIGKVWANGECGVSKEKRVPVSRTVLRTADEETRWNSAMLAVHGLEVCLEHKGIRLINFLSGVCDSNHKGDVGEVREGQGTLGSSLVPNSHSTPRGQKGISRYGAKLVRNGAFLIEKTSPVGTLSFLTTTLPDVSPEESEAIASNWSEIVRVFLQWLRRVLRKSSLPGEIVGCTEVQEKRAEKTGVFGLHLHLVFVGRGRNSSWKVSCEDVREAWKRALSPFLSKQVDGYDWSACENLQMVKKSAQGYLGKYLSKGLKSCQRMRALFPNIRFPSNWYVCTNSLRAKVRALTLRVSGDLGLLLLDILESGDSEWVEYAAPIKVPCDGHMISIGYVGRLTAMGRREFSSLVKASRKSFVEASVGLGQFLVKGV